MVCYSNNCKLHFMNRLGKEERLMKLQAGQIKEYGTFMNLTLAKKNKPGDGKNGLGVKKG
ncbi:hypothetical protein C7121_10610 [Paenibacillus glucanolyticus]|nr:hypothetical protein A3958_05695 [Paenibacillus glucanolyticus]AVV56543.1 hypothetical protein C7121_10610 [Paenibacillus glucanolyticus]